MLFVALLNPGSLDCQTAQKPCVNYAPKLPSLCCGTALGPAVVLLFSGEPCSSRAALQVTGAALATSGLTFAVISYTQSPARLAGRSF